MGGRERLPLTRFYSQFGIIINLDIYSLAQFVAPLEILAYGDEGAQYYGSLSALLEKQGTPIGSLDILIAAHTLSMGYILVTNNEKEFNRIPNLKIDNWVK